MTIILGMSGGLDSAAPRVDREAKAHSCEWARNKQLTLRLWTLRWYTGSAGAQRARR
jgi:hypothetical protein